VGKRDSLFLMTNDKLRMGDISTSTLQLLIAY